MLRTNFAARVKSRHVQHCLSKPVALDETVSPSLANATNFAMLSGGGLSVGFGRGPSRGGSNNSSRFCAPVPDLTASTVEELGALAAGFDVLLFERGWRVPASAHAVATGLAAVARKNGTGNAAFRNAASRNYAAFPGLGVVTVGSMGAVDHDASALRLFHKARFHAIGGVGDYRDGRTEAAIDFADFLLAQDEDDSGGRSGRRGGDSLGGEAARNGGRMGGRVVVRAKKEESTAGYGGAAGLASIGKILPEKVEEPAGRGQTKALSREDGVDAKKADAGKAAAAETAAETAPEPRWSWVRSWFGGGLWGAAPPTAAPAGPASSQPAHSARKEPSPPRSAPAPQAVSGAGADRGGLVSDQLQKRVFYELARESVDQVLGTVLVGALGTLSALLGAAPAPPGTGSTAGARGSGTAAHQHPGPSHGTSNYVLCILNTPLSGHTPAPASYPPSHLFLDTPPPLPPTFPPLPPSPPCKDLTWYTRTRGCV